MTDPMTTDSSIDLASIEEWKNQAATYPSDWKNTRILALILHLKQTVERLRAAEDRLKIITRYRKEVERPDVESIKTWMLGAATGSPLAVLHPEWGLDLCNYVLSLETKLATAEAECDELAASLLGTSQQEIINHREIVRLREQVDRLEA